MRVVRAVAAVSVLVVLAGGPVGVLPPRSVAQASIAATVPLASDPSAERESDPSAERIARPLPHRGTAGGHG